MIKLKNKNQVVSPKSILTTLGTICILCGISSFIFDLMSLINTHGGLAITNILIGSFCLFVGSIQES